MASTSAQASFVLAESLWPCRAWREANEDRWELFAKSGSRSAGLVVGLFDAHELRFAN